MKTVFDTVNNQSLLDLHKYSNASGYSNAHGKWKKWIKGKEEKAKTKFKERAKKFKEKLKALGTKVMRYSGLGIIARAGVLAAFRVNLFGMAKRMYPAFLTQEQLKKGHFKIANAARAKAHWDKLADYYEKKLGGKKENLMRDIKAGWDKPIFKTKAVREHLESENSQALLDAASASQGGTSKKGFDGADFWEDATGEESNFGKHFCKLVGGRTGGKVGAMPSRNNPKETPNGMDGNSFYTMKDKMIHKNGGASSVEGSRDYDIENEMFSNVTGVDDAVIIAAAIPPIVTIITQMKNSNVDSNPYEDGSPEGDQYNKDQGNADQNGDLNPPELDQEDQDALKKMEDAGSSDAKKGGEDVQEDKIFGMPKRVAIGVGIGLGILAIWGIVKLVKRGKAGK